MEERNYALGTHEAELERLGFQHRAWRPMAYAGWQRAGVNIGSRVLDVGAGPGYATRDLAEMVESGGEVVALERSARFVEAGKQLCASHGLQNVRYHELDVITDSWPIPEGGFDAAWVRWLASFVSSPEILVEKLAEAVRPGGRVILHEYAQIHTTRFAPPIPQHEEFLRHLEESVRGMGGNINIAATLLALLAEAGFILRSATPMVYCVGPEDHLWNWPVGFVPVNLARLVELALVSQEWATETLAAVEAASANPYSRLITPMVMEIIVERRA